MLLPHTEEEDKGTENLDSVAQQDNDNFHAKFNKQLVRNLFFSAL